VLFGLLSVSTYLTMDIYAVVRPERSDEALSSLKAWIDRHTDVIVVVVAAAVGLWLVGKSSYLLAT
jgi:ribosomal protein L31E